MPNPEEHVNRHEEKSREICALTARARSWRGTARAWCASAAHLHGSLNCAQQPADLRLHSYRILPMNIAHLRQEYMRAGLSEAHALADPLAQFQRWFEEAQAAELPLVNAMTLATVGADGAPAARVVLLKGIEGGGFVFYTNYAGRKGRELAAEPRACLVFLWSELERQVRIEGRTQKVPAADSDAYFDSRPLGARLSAWASAQSERVADRATLERALEGMKHKYGKHPPRPPHWGGYRLLPEAIEFWQGRADRLHDRLLYTRAGARWTIERLAP
jgi:pyridoxamine 5'-phosphate oxidase